MIISPRASWLRRTPVCWGFVRPAVGIPGNKVIWNLDYRSEQIIKCIE